MYLNYKGYNTIVNEKYMYCYDDSTGDGILIKDGYVYKVEFDEVSQPSETFNNIKFEKKLNENIYERALITVVGSIDLFKDKNITSILDLLFL